MIKVQRTRVKIPNILDLNDTSSRASIETKKAIDFFNDPINAKKEFRFKVYSDSEVREALRKLFFNKCAYCESYITPTDSIQIEHYRPKKAIIINNKMQFPGYYWLASDWDNLLPSCVHCNQIRKHLYDDGTTILGGKGNKFPLENESLRMRKHNDKDQEEPLLLNPCKDTIENELTFLKNGTITTNTKKGDTSIKVYALMRKRLRRARREHAMHIRHEIFIIKNLVEAINLANNPVQKEILMKLYKSSVKKLRKRMHSNQPYSALSRQMIRPFLSSLALLLKGCVKYK